MSYYAKDVRAFQRIPGNSTRTKMKTFLDNPRKYYGIFHYYLPNNLTVIWPTSVKQRFWLHRSKRSISENRLSLVMIYY